MVRTLLLLLAAATAGCRAPLKPHPFDVRSTPVERVAVLPVHHDEDLLFEYANDQLETLNALAPGPLGTAISAAIGASARSGFNDSIGRPPEAYAADLTIDIVETVSDAGFIARPVDAGVLGDDPERSGGLLDSLPAAVFADDDAVLESYLELGFVAAGRGEPFRPTAWLTLRATRRDGRVLFIERIMFNASTSDDGDFVALRGIRLHVPEWLEFEGRDAVLAGRDGQVALDYAVDRLVAEFRFLLRGPWL